MAKNYEIEVYEGEVLPAHPPLNQVTNVPPGAVAAPTPGEVFGGPKNKYGYFTPGGRGHGRYKLIRTEAELQERIDNYFASCMSEHYDEETGQTEYIWSKPPSMAGLARSLGISVSCLRNYRHSQEYGETVEAARALITEFLETGMLTPGHNPRGYEFLLKNTNQGYSDTQRISVETGNRLEDARTDEEILALISELPPD